MKANELMKMVKASFREENASYRIVSQKVAAKLASKLENILAEAEDNGFMTKPKDATCPVCGETISARKFAITFVQNQFVQNKNRFKLDEVDLHLLEDHHIIDEKLLKKLTRKPRTNSEETSKEKKVIKSKKEEKVIKSKKEEKPSKEKNVIKSKKEEKPSKEKKVIKSKKDTYKEVSVGTPKKVKVRKSKKSVNEDFDD